MKYFLFFAITFVASVAFSAGTTSPSGIPGVRPAPSWVQTLPNAQWTVISLNKINDVNAAKEFPANTWYGCEGLAGIMDDWNGGALASNYGQAGALLVWGGGHCGYGGSDVYGFDLYERKWKRVSNPYGINGEDVMGVTSQIATFPDGSPIPTHTYDLAEYHPTSNSFTLLSAQTNVPGTYYVGIVHMLNLNHLTADKYVPSMWKRSQVNTTPGKYGVNLEGGTSCYDRNRDSFWLWEAPNSYDSTGFLNKFTNFSPNTNNSDGTVGKYTNYIGDGGGFGGGGAADCDPKKDLFVFTQYNGGDASRIYYRDLKNPSVGAKKLTSYSGTIPSVSGSNGWEYSDSRDAFLYWNGGTNVHSLKIADRVDRLYSSAAWSQISSGGVTPEMNMNRNFSRFRIAKFNVNGVLQEVAIIAGTTGIKSGELGYVYAFKIPADATSLPLTISPPNNFQVK